MRRSTPYRCLAVGLLSLTAAASALPGHGDRAPPPVRAGKPVDFAADVWPILQERCVRCHGPQKQRGELRLDQKDAALAGGETGKAILPGNAGASPLLRRVTSLDRKDRMPPDGDRLTAAQVAALRAWIDQGADFSGVAAAPDPRTRHWAFQPVVRPAPPAVNDGRWPRNPVDHFILARLDRERPAGWKITAHGCANPLRGCTAARAHARAWARSRANAATRRPVE